MPHCIHPSFHLNALVHRMNVLLSLFDAHPRSDDIQVSVGARRNVFVGSERRSTTPGLQSSTSRTADQGQRNAGIARRI
jgi:hypothetical protein